MACVCDKYHAGMMTQPVSFERATTTDSGRGGYTESWGGVAGASTFGHMKALSGSERWASGRTEAVAKFKLVVRFFDGLVESDSVVFKNRRHNIRFINNIEFKDLWLEIDLDGGAAV